MYGNFDGIGTLMVLGMMMLVLLVAAVPVAAIYGIAWLIEPRVAFDVFNAAFWLSAAWAVGSTVFMSCVLFAPPRHSGWGWW